jgi:aquaporin Z
VRKYRSIGPALFVQGWALPQLWLFIVAPLVGAAIAALAYGAIRAPDTVTTLAGERSRASKPNAAIPHRASRVWQP